MITNEKLMKSLKKDVTKLESKAKYSNLYNIRNLIIRLGIKSGIVLEKSIPFVLSGTVIFSTFKYVFNKQPFIIDKCMKKNSLQTIDTINTHIEKSSYDIDYEDEKIEFSTGWKLKDNGVYERVSTLFEINDSIDLNDLDSIFKMSEKEIRQMLKVKKVETITKKQLSTEDGMYNEDTIIITNHKIGDEEKLVDESTSDNVKSTIIICVLYLAFGLAAYKILKINYFETKFGPLCLTEYKKISKEDLLKMKKVLAIRKQNLELLEESSKVLKKSGVKNG